MIAQEPIHIRVATKADMDGIQAVFYEADALHHASAPQYIAAPTSGARPREFLLGRMSTQNAAMLLAEVDGSIAGIIQLEAVDSPPIAVLTPRRYCKIDTVAVAAAYRRRGIGTLLMRAAEAWAKAHGCSEITLGVYDFNKGAIAFYESLGLRAFMRRMTKPLPAQDPEPAP